jgi:quinol monooxygenase YgiN
VYARSATIQADVRSIDDGVTYIRDEVMPELLRVDGCHGLSLIVDRNSGRCIATTAWESAEALQASTERAQRSRDRAEQMFGGPLQYEEWEIAIMHRDHPSHDGACVRVTWMQRDPSEVDQGIDFMRTSALPNIEHYEGFCSASLLVDRSSGRLVASVTLDSRAALEHGREQATRIRAQGAEQTGARMLDVGEFELALAHLRIPELV